MLVYSPAMSIQEIVDRLPQLSVEELDALNERLQEARTRAGKSESLQQMIERLAGTVDDLPEDYSTQIDHYLYGLPKR
jgi:hypothetical protein